MFGPGLNTAGGQALQTIPKQTKLEFHPAGRFFVVTTRPGEDDEIVVRIPMERVSWWK